ncbi:hypothetical protein FCOIX_8998 [Fusarium coicis]|nr:hypothetical protein FCOIX_8998 [Fusarium coicis]
MAPAPNYDQASFWTKVLNEKLDINLASKFKNWKNLKECVECWCLVRRTLLREGRLPAVSQSQPEHLALVDSWNKVFAERFCRPCPSCYYLANGQQPSKPIAGTKRGCGRKPAQAAKATVAIKRTPGTTNSRKTIFTNARTKSVRRQLLQGPRFTVFRHMGGESGY